LYLAPLFLPPLLVSFSRVSLIWFLTCSSVSSTGIVGAPRRLPPFPVFAPPPWYPGRFPPCPGRFWPCPGGRFPPCPGGRLPCAPACPGCVAPGVPGFSMRFL